MIFFRKKLFWPFDPRCVTVKGRIFACMMFYASFPLIWNETDYFQERKNWPFDPGVKGVCKGKIFASMLLYASFPLIWYATWPYSEKVNFISAYRCDPSDKAFIGLRGII